VVRHRSQLFAVVRPLLKTLKKRQSLTKILNLIWLKNKKFARKICVCSYLVNRSLFCSKINVFLSFYS
jgi:hypothetical protein